MGTEILCAEGALAVRRFREGDLPALAALLADPEVMRWLEPPFDRARAAEFLRTTGLSEPPLIYAAEEDGAFLGYVIFHRYGGEDAAELGWVLDCYTMFGELSRMTQFKDKSAKNADNINAGLFTYPALMAADILLYQADLVPVGGDQKQHVEICRDIATRFNGLYGDTFKLPDPYIPKVGARIMSLTTPTSKMSKSDKDQNGCVYMLEKPEDILRKFKKAMTDSDACVRFDPENKPGVSNLMQIYSVATGRDYAAIEAEFAGQGYGSFKTAVGESVVELLRPIREETERLLADKAYLESVYRAGAEKAAYVANRTLSKVYKKVGFLAR